MTLTARMLRPIVFLSGVVVLATVMPVARASATLRMSLKPGVVVLHQRPTIIVSGIRIAGLEARLDGATDTSGKLLPWQRLRSVGGEWRGTLTAPALHGIYPVLLRDAAHERAFASHGLRLRVFVPGTGSRPSFERPLDVVNWWVRAIEHATLVAVKAWPL